MKEIRITASVLESEFRYLANLLKKEKYKIRDKTKPYLKMEVSTNGIKKYRLMLTYFDDLKEDRVFSTAEYMSMREMHYHIVGLVEGIKRGIMLERIFLTRQLRDIGINLLPENRQASLEKALEYLTKNIDIKF